MSKEEFFNVFILQFSAIRIQKEDQERMKGESNIMAMSIKEICYEVFGDSKCMIMTGLLKTEIIIVYVVHKPAILHY